MLPELDTTDWEEAFGYRPPHYLDAAVSDAPVSRDDVAEILARWEQDGDYAEWEGYLVARLADGRYIGVVGWCDTTGWGCQDAADVFVGSSWDVVLRFGLTEDARARLGYPALEQLLT